MLPRPPWYSSCAISEEKGSGNRTESSTDLKVGVWIVASSMFRQLETDIGSESSISLAQTQGSLPIAMMKFSASQIQQLPVGLFHTKNGIFDEFFSREGGAVWVDNGSIVC